MDKVVVYCGTRNLYEDMIPAMKSLLFHTKVDRIYLLIEDDIFPYKLPDLVKTINVSGQTYFDPDGPNYKSYWTYMVLMRAALTKVLPEYDQVLSLDVDTIIQDDISELWEINLNDCYVAGVPESKKTNSYFTYINFGVAMINLKKFRETGMDDVIIKDLNTEDYFANEQDSINNHCQGGIYTLSSRYNSCEFTKKGNNPKIIHFAGIGNFPWSECKRWQDAPIINQYRKMTWAEVMK